MTLVRLKNGHVTQAKARKLGVHFSYSESNPKKQDAAKAAGVFSVELVNSLKRQVERNAECC